MLTDFAVHPSLATADIGSARSWYAERLGLEPLYNLGSLLAYQVGPSLFTVFETPSAGTARNTVALWLVDDLRTEMARLRGRGVVFEDLDLGPDERTIDGLMTGRDPMGGDVLNAWFRDGDGNWIGMVQQGEHAGEPPVLAGIGVALAASDLVRARAWYAEKLGLEPLHDYGDELVYRQGATQLSIYLTPAAGTAKNTVAVWRVDDLASEMATLRARHVAFEEYEDAEPPTIDGVHTNPENGTRTAWFMDSESNVLGIVEDHGIVIRPR